MCYVITNGNAYINIAKNNRIRVTYDFGDAAKFSSIDSDGIKLASQATARTKNFYILNLDTNYRYYFNGRRRFTKLERQEIYNKANGRCALCGRKVLFDEFTIDHIVPIAMNGSDDMENLQCTCVSCNQFKGACLPENFQERINQLFMYQMEQKCENTLLWKFAKYILGKLIARNQ